MKKTFEDFIESSDYYPEDKQLLKEIFTNGRTLINDVDKTSNGII